MYPLMLCEVPPHDAGLVGEIALNDSTQDCRRVYTCRRGRTGEKSEEEDPISSGVVKLG